MIRLRGRLIPLGIVAIFGILIALEVIDGEKLWYRIRYVFFRTKGIVTNPGGPTPTQGNIQNAKLCRANLHAIQTAKRKAAFNRGNQIGPISAEEILRVMPNAPARKVAPSEADKFLPRCPEGGHYTYGTLEELPKCTVGGQNTLTFEDDHIIRD